MEQALLAWEPEDQDRAVCDVYGDWDPLTPEELRDHMTGFPGPWWVVGGHAIEAFTGIARVHEDIDLVVFCQDVPALRAQFAGVFHLWSQDGGVFRILDDEHPEPLAPLSQVWMRRDARSPWRVDCILNPQDHGRWVSKRDPAHVADLDDVTWVADDGVRYLLPELTLLFKAKQARRKDEVDLESAWPLLSVERRTWLRDAVRRLHRGHPWSDRLARP